MSWILINKEYNYGTIKGQVNGRIGFIAWLCVYPGYRNQGKGINLIKEFLIEAYNIGIIHVELHDCSDNYRTNHNIYLKCGFKYIDDGLMHANVRQSLLVIEKLKLR